jgi:hypothetical protein
MDGKSRPQLRPPFLGEGAGMAHVLAAAIRSTGAKREAQFERLGAMTGARYPRCERLLSL